MSPYQRNSLFSLLCLFLLVTIAFGQDAPMYHEVYRPQLHYSAPCRWLNDPNGLVYHAGEYHLFYQFHPFGLTWGPMHWGHAVSPDLIHWETLPIALFPDDNGTIFSGSVVIDSNNTAGFGANALVAIYSYNTQTQGVAYSTDNGRTWTKYDGNPVIDALAKDFRDPKVFWHEATQKWVMVIAAGREIQIFTSANLLEWEYASTFTTIGTTGVWEVPDLFSLEVNGEMKWVLIVSISAGTPAGGSGTMYFIGDFDGVQFTPDVEHEILWLDYGADNYAGTTFYNAPDGKRIFIGWMNNWVYGAEIPTSTWRGAMTLPRELSLVSTADGLRLVQQPIEAITTLRQLLGTWENLDISDVLPLDDVQGRRLEIIVEMEAGTAARFGINLHQSAESQTRVMYFAPREQLLVSRSDNASGRVIPRFTPAFGAPLTLTDNRLRLRLIVDESSVEVFVNDGMTTLTSQMYENPAGNGVSLFAENGTARLINMEIYALQSIWSDGVSELTFDFCE